MMSKTFFYLTLLGLFTHGVSAQIMQKFGDNTNSINNKAVLEIESTTKGFLLPRMNKVQRDLINNPPEGLMLWCTDCSLSNGSEIQVWINNSWTGLLISNLAENSLFLGNSLEKATAVLINGDITINGAGTTTIGTNKVLSSMINDETIITADIASNAISTAKILSANVTYAKIQNVNPNTILGRIDPSAGIVEEISVTGTGSVAMSNSPIFTGIPLAPTANVATNSNQIATTAFVLANTNGYQSINASQEIATTSTTDLMVDGMSINPGAGIYSVQFNGQYSSSSTGSTARAVNDLTTAYQELLNFSTTDLHTNSFGSGETLSAGVYATSGAGSIAGILTLDGTETDLFIFKINGALTTGADSIVNLTGGALACNVFWVATSVGAMSIAASTQMVGNLFAKDAAATIGAGSILVGRLFSNTGAMTIGPSTLRLPIGNALIDLGELSSYVVFTASGAVDNSGTSTITGNIGTNLGAITGFESPTVVNGSLFTPVADIGGAISSFSLYQNGTLISNSTRTNIGKEGQIVLNAIATVSDGQAIEVRWNTSLGIVKLKNRILTIIQVR